jgi:hypothetical protein
MGPVEKSAGPFPFLRFVHLVATKLSLAPLPFTAGGEFQYHT